MYALESLRKLRASHIPLEMWIVLVKFKKKLEALASGMALEVQYDFWLNATEMGRQYTTGGRSIESVGSFDLTTYIATGL